MSKLKFQILIVQDLNLAYNREMAFSIVCSLLLFKWIIYTCWRQAMLASTVPYPIDSPPSGPNVINNFTLRLRHSIIHCKQIPALQLRQTAKMRVYKNIETWYGIMPTRCVCEKIAQSVAHSTFGKIIRTFYVPYLKVAIMFGYFCDLKNCPK
jgi:hypothetical protein